MNTVLNKINIFRKPTPHEVAAIELEDAQHQLLKAMSAVEYAKAMVTYHSDRVNRLWEYK